MSALASPPCESWRIAWHTQKWREETYVPEQLLRGWTLRGSSCHGCAPPRRPGRSKEEAEGAAAAAEPLPEMEDCSVVVVRIRQYPGCEESVRIAEAYRAARLRHWFLLLGEENEPSCETCAAFYAAAPLVARHYHEPTCQAVPSVLTLPMGVVAGMAGVEQAGSAVPASQRRLAWSFASGVHSGARTTLARLLQTSPAAAAMAPNLLYYPWAPQPGTRQDAAEFLSTLCGSAFVFCPRGNHEDTWRFYEALACGAIPVVTDRRYFARFMPADLVAPLLETRCTFALSASGRRRDDVTSCDAASHEAALASMAALLADPPALDARQAALRAAVERHEGAWRAELDARVRAATASPAPAHADEAAREDPREL